MNFIKQPAKMGRDGKNTCSPSKNAPIFLSLSFSSGSSSSCEAAREGSIARSSFSNSSSLSPPVSSRFATATTVSSRAPDSRTLSSTLPSESDILPRTVAPSLTTRQHSWKKHPVHPPATSKKNLLFFELFPPVRLFYFFSRGRKFYECEFSRRDSNAIVERRYG